MFRIGIAWLSALSTPKAKKSRRRRPLGSYSRTLRVEELEGRQVLSANILWMDQFGTSANDQANGAAVDGSGNVYVASHTYGNLAGVNAGSRDAVVSKYDSTGSLLWARQLGTSSDDIPQDVWADAAGNAYVVGVTQGSLGGTSAGSSDAFVAKYNPSGTLLWTRQLGTSSSEQALDVCVDLAGNVYIAGSTQGSLAAPNAGSGDGFVAKYNASGTLLWTKQFGTSAGDSMAAVSVDSAGNIYVAGSTQGNLGAPNAGGADAFVLKLSSSGTLLWSRQLGTANNDTGEIDIALDGTGSVYISAYTDGNIGGTPAGGFDAWIGKYDSSGTLSWVTQFGTTAHDFGTSMSVDGAGNVYIAGRTKGNLGGANAGLDDGFVAKFDSSGASVWSQQFGTSSDDDINGVWADGLGNVYVAGYSFGNLEGTNAGLNDGWVARLSERWDAQLGTNHRDESYGVATDALGNSYVTGFTGGALNGANAGIYDAFVSKYDAVGMLLWTRQLGTVYTDIANAIAVDAAGNSYITGYTDGDLGGVNAGSRDVFIAKYDSSGTLLWTRQLGTIDDEVANGAAVDGSGNVYITGYTYDSLFGTNAGGTDAFVVKYDASGTLQWSQQFGTSNYDFGTSASVDSSGSIYIAGATAGSMSGANAGGNDAFVTKFNSGGTLLWTRQLGTSSADSASGVSVDGLGNVYIAGYTVGSLSGANAGLNDSFVAKYDASGTLLWTRQLGTSGTDVAHSVSADSSGNVYIAGYTTGSLSGSNFGSNDAFITKYDASGTLVWTQQLGTSSSDSAYGVSVNGLGEVFIAGVTYGSLNGPNAGLSDIFLMNL